MTIEMKKVYFDGEKVVTQNIPESDIYKLLAVAQPEQEPVAWMHIQGNYQEPSFRQLDDWEIKNGFKQYPLYATPPQRKPLTDEEIMNLCAAQWASHPIEVARIIEAAHGIKENT